MRLIRLLLVVLGVLVVGGTVVGQTNNQRTNAQSDSVKTYAEAQNLSNGLPSQAHQRSLQALPDGQADQDSCLVLHTIRVARDNKSFDATHVVDVRDCTPASRFQMKAAVAHPAPRK